ncbi:hypothetical protein F5I97DRAFT_1830249 [Phlebopus sp. FC_14]|nr:hypothetical protein F5I97DRAFT_1830249 [Phlebopus sp. FC_14]
MKGRRFGAENHLGMGGGTVSREVQRNLEKAEDLCRKREPEKALPYLLKAMEDDNNLDAFVPSGNSLSQQARYRTIVYHICGIFSKSPCEAKGREGLQRLLGKNCFDGSTAKEYDGRCYRLLETRSFMRVLQAQVHLYCENGLYDKSTEAIIKMLRLCPGDNLGQRSWLGSVLLHCNRPSDALSFAHTWLVQRHEVPRGGTNFTASSSACLSSSQEESMSKYGNGAMAHTAAIASFKVFGDCDLSRHYVCFFVAYVFLVTGSLNISSRALNGPEDAQDYLFLTQDLWMEPAVWEWANSAEEAKRILFKTCANADCGAVETDVAQFKRCAACKEV